MGGTLSVQLLSHFLKHFPSRVLWTENALALCVCVCVDHVISAREQISTTLSPSNYGTVNTLLFFMTQEQIVTQDPIYEKTSRKKCKIIGILRHVV